MNRSKAMSTDVLMVRIYLSEADQGRRTNLMREILSALHDKHAVKGVTVFRGVAGFGADGEVHADDMLRLNVDLPLVIEFFDQPTAAETAIRFLEPLVAQGHIVSWAAKRHGPATPSS
jgi:PII-like signaling protein